MRIVFFKHDHLSERETHITLLNIIMPAASATATAATMVASRGTTDTPDLHLWPCGGSTYPSTLGFPGGVNKLAARLRVREEQRRGGSNTGRNTECRPATVVPRTFDHVDGQDRFNVLALLTVGGLYQPREEPQSNPSKGHNSSINSTARCDHSG